MTEPVKTQRRTRWWTPLLLPLAIAVIGVSGDLAQGGTRIVHNSIGTAIMGVLSISLFFVLPTFIAGRRCGRANPN